MKRNGAGKSLADDRAWIPAKRRLGSLVAWRRSLLDHGAICASLDIR